MLLTNLYPREGNDDKPVPQIYVFLHDMYRDPSQRPKNSDDESDDEEPIKFEDYRKSVKKILARKLYWEVGMQ